MSVAGLTISYIAVPDFSVSLENRKTIFTVLVLSLIVFISLYLYFAGQIVALGIRAYDLKDGLNQALILSSEKEAELIKSVYRKNSDFFAAAGYEKPLSIEVIRRSLNVVEIQQTRPLY